MAGKFLCPRCFELQSLDSIEYICSNTSTTSKCQHAIDRMPQHPANAKKPVCEECGQPLVTKICLISELQRATLSQLSVLKKPVKVTMLQF